MPAGKCHHDNANRRQEYPIGQHRILIAIKPVAPVCAEKRQQGYGDNEMRPGWCPRANAGDKQQFCGPGDAGKHTEQKSRSRSPHRSSRPEYISRPPVKRVGSKNTECKRNRKRDAHGMDRVTEDRNAGLSLIKTRVFTDRVDKFFAFALDRFRHVGPLPRLSLTFLTLFTLGGCQGELSTLSPAGPAARDIATLWWGMLVGALLILSFVMLLILMAFRRPAKTADEAQQVRVWIVNLGLIFPVSILLALLVYGLVIGERLLPRSSAEVITVEAEASRWSWTLSYPDRPGLQTQDVLHIPAGRPVDIEITSTDVIHSFWVPRVAGKMDAVPGHVNVLRIEADRPGRYAGRSAEFSGSGYASFGFTLIAHDPTAWESFLAGETG